MAPTTEGLMNLQETAEFMGCSTVTIRRMEKRGELPMVKLPGTRLVRFRRATLQRLIETSEKRQPAPMHDYATPEPIGETSVRSAVSD
jgi:excisionase family DNA binding protein